MQHSADFTSFLGYQADVVRAERAIEIQRRIAERRDYDRARDAGPVTESPANPRRHARRTPRLATR